MTNRIQTPSLEAAPLASRLWLGLALVAALTVSLGAALLLPARSAALPEGRVFEMVSPPYKGSYGVSSFAAPAPDGESVAFASLGAYSGALVNNATGNYFVARRTSGFGWATSSLEPPAELAVPETFQSEYTLDFSPTLGSTLWVGCAQPNVAVSASNCREVKFLAHDTSLPDTNASWREVGEPIVAKRLPVAEYDLGSASVDFCHIVFRNGTGEPLLAEDDARGAALYETAGGCGEEPALRMVGVDNKGERIDPYCGESVGGKYESAGSNAFNAVSADGQTVFFTDNVNPAQKGLGCNNTGLLAANPSQLFVRLGGLRTVEVSRPLEPGEFSGCVKGGVPGEVPCGGAASRPASLFWGASEDGSIAYFTSAARLVSGDSDESTNLYVVKIGCPASSEDCAVSEREVVSLDRASQPVGSSEAAEVQGVVKVAPDGSHVALVARGVLSAEAGPEGHTAIKGADNLYIYDNATGRAKFVADLCSGPAESGAVADAHCPPNLTPGGLGVNDSYLWQEDGNSTNEAQFNICMRISAGECTGSLETGRFLVFASYGQLTRDDTDNSKDVFRYDLQSDGLDRVSTGEAGYHANGSCEEQAGESVCDANVTPSGIEFAMALYATHELPDRAVSEDGSRIVFSTAAPLSALASNGLGNIYEWHEGEGATRGAVSIISTGSSPTADVARVITPSGRDVFFATSQGLLPQDTDGQRDVYDARLGGGFPVAPDQAEPCSGDACQGPLTNPAPLLVPGSVSQAAVPRLAAGLAGPESKAKAKGKTKAKSKRKRRRAKRTGKKRKPSLRSGSALGRGRR